MFPPDAPLQNTVRKISDPPISTSSTLTKRSSAVREMWPWMWLPTHSPASTKGASIAKPINRSASMKPLTANTSARIVTDSSTMLESVARSAPLSLKRRERYRQHDIQREQVRQHRDGEQRRAEGGNAEDHVRRGDSGGGSDVRREIERDSHETKKLPLTLPPPVGAGKGNLVHCFILLRTYLAAIFVKLLPVAPKEVPLGDKGEVGRGMGAYDVYCHPIPTLALPLKGRE